MAAKRQPTNHDLAKIVNDGFIAVGKRIDNSDTKIEKLGDEVSTLNTFMAVQKDRDSRPSGSGVNISPDIIKIILLLGGIISALVGASKIQ